MRKFSPIITALFLALAACGGTESDDIDTSGTEVRAERNPPATEVRPTDPERRDDEERDRDRDRDDATRCRSRIECRVDDSCPRGSYCETGLGFCFTSSRCIVNGRPSTRFCQAEYGDNFVCAEYAPGSHHCVPLEIDLCRE